MPCKWSRRQGIGCDGSPFEPSHHGLGCAKTADGLLVGELPGFGGLPSMWGGGVVACWRFGLVGAALGGRCGVEGRCCLL